MRVVCVQVAFRVREGLAQQLLQYEVIAGAYLPVAEPRPLNLEALTLLIPAVLAEQARACCCHSALRHHSHIIILSAQDQPIGLLLFPVNVCRNEESDSLLAACRGNSML